MVLLLAMTTSVVGSTKAICFIVAGRLLDGNVNRDIIKEKIALSLKHNE